MYMYMYVSVDHVVCTLYICSDELAVSRERLTAKEEEISKTKGTDARIQV